MRTPIRVQVLLRCWYIKKSWGPFSACFPHTTWGKPQTRGADSSRGVGEVGREGAVTSSSPPPQWQVESISEKGPLIQFFAQLIGLKFFNASYLVIHFFCVSPDLIAQWSPFCVNHYIWNSQVFNISSWLSIFFYIVIYRALYSEWRHGSVSIELNISRSLPQSTGICWAPTGVELWDEYWWDTTMKKNTDIKDFVIHLEETVET